MEIHRRRNLLIGILTGLVLPILVILMAYLVKFSHYSLKEFVVLLLLMKVAGNFLQLAGISNLLLFFVFLNFNKVYAARGVILATLLLAFFVAFLMFL